MFGFLTNVVDQIDLAAGHVSKGDPTNSRIGMMLADNVLEIVLHRIVQNNADLDGFRYSRPHPAVDPQLFTKALGRNFDDKVRFATKIGFIDLEVADTIRTFHDFRNEIYHAGLQHGPVLPTLARFHLFLVADTISRYRPTFLSYSTSDVVPERARPYFSPLKLPMRGWTTEFADACTKLAASAGYEPSDLAKVLSDHMLEVVDRTDRFIEILATEGRQVVSRDEVVRSTQAYMIAFTEEGKAFARGHLPQPLGWPAYLDWFERTYRLPVPRDPVRGWRSRQRRLSVERNPHAALKRYRTFMTETEQFRDWIDEHLRALENWHEEISGRG